MINFKNLKEKFMENLLNILISCIILVILFVFVDIIFFFEQTIPTLRYFEATAAFLTLIMLFFFITETRKEKQLEKEKNKRKEELKTNFRVALNELVNSVEGELKELIPLFSNIKEEIVNSLHNEFLQTYLMEERLSTEKDYEITKKIFDVTSKKLKLSEGEKYFLTYIFLHNKKESLLEKFKEDIPTEKPSTELFYKLLNVYGKNKKGSLQKILEMSKKITPKELEEEMNRLQKTKDLYNQLKNTLAKKEKNTKRIISIGQQVFASKIREKNLLSLSKYKSNMVVVDASGSKLPKAVKKYGVNPIYTALKDLGFIKVFGHTFMLKRDDFDEKENFDKIIKDIKDKTEYYWRFLKNTPQGKKLKTVKKGPIYKYAIWRINESNFSLQSKNSEFTNEFKEKILYVLKPEEALALILESPHEVKSIIKSMEIDNLMETSSDIIKNTLRRNEKTLRNKINNQLGFKINDITDYRKLKNKITSFTKTIRSVLNKKVKFRKQEIIQASKEIIKNSREYYSLFRKFGAI